MASRIVESKCGVAPIGKHASSVEQIEKHLILLVLRNYRPTNTKKCKTIRSVEVRIEQILFEKKLFFQRPATVAFGLWRGWW